MERPAATSETLTSLATDEWLGGQVGLIADDEL
jgi:hypothetical protein